jgi:hypothetical protein
MPTQHKASRTSAKSIQIRTQNCFDSNLAYMDESAFIPFVSFGDLDNNTFKGLTSLLSVEQEIQYDEHT